MGDQENYVGKCIGNYRIVALIGSGGFGSVYQGEHAILNERIVAIKVLHTHLSSQEQRTNFLQEARLLGHLQHLHILQIFDTGIDTGLPYLVTEYASHGSLRDLLNRHTQTILPEDESLTILSQVGEALSYAHQQHIIHRDLKPENILFNTNDGALLADFGIATTLSTSSVKYSSVIGTPAYMAPEQFQGTLSQQGDQYALGCIAYELFTGQKPFHSSDFFAMGFKHLTDNPVAPTQLNPALPMYIEQAILKAMAKQRGDRHADVQTFVAALQGSTLSHRSVRPQSVQGLSTPQADMTDGDLRTMPASHLSQAQTVLRGSTINHEQHSRHYPAQRVSFPVQNVEEKPRGETGGILPTQQVLPPVEPGWNGGLPYQPLQPQPRHTEHSRVILTVACALIALAIIAPLLFVGLPNLLHARTSTKIVYVPVTTRSAQSTSTVASHGRALSDQPTRPVTKSAPTNIPATVSPTQVPPSHTPTVPAMPTPTPTQPKTITAETFRVYFNSANASGQGVSTQHTYSGTVSIIVSGYGRASSPEYSDAFYIYTDTSGNPLSTPHTSTCLIMYINGNTADSSVGLPNYESSHTYSVTMNVSQPGTINFGICGQPSDHVGYLIVTVQQQ